MFSVDNEFRHKEVPPFVDDGFMTGSIVLPGLDMPLTLSTKHYFKFDGVVPDMWRYLLSLSPDMRYYLDDHIGDPKFRTAFNKGFLWYSHTGMFMAVKDLSPRVNLNNMAHEASEIAFRLGYKSELQEHLNAFGLSKSIDELKTHEVGALSSILTVKENGMDVSSLYRQQDPETFHSLTESGYLQL